MNETSPETDAGAEEARGKLEDALGRPTRESFNLRIKAAVATLPFSFFSFFFCIFFSAAIVK